MGTKEIWNAALRRPSLLLVQSKDEGLLYELADRLAPDLRWGEPGRQQRLPGWGHERRMAEQQELEAFWLDPSGHPNDVLNHSPASCPRTARASEFNRANRLVWLP